MKTLGMHLALLGGPKQEFIAPRDKVRCQYNLKKRQEVGYSPGTYPTA
jgi:hypothetical protein